MHLNIVSKRNYWTGKLGCNRKIKTLNISVLFVFRKVRSDDYLKKNTLIFFFNLDFCQPSLQNVDLLGEF